MPCFSKARRLLNKRDYDFVFEQAKKLVTPEYIVLYRANTLGYPRLGLALSKKMISKAHDRNRLKRLIREAFRNAGLPAFDLIFLARTGVAKVENNLIRTRLNTTWAKLNA